MKGQRNHHPVTNNKQTKAKGKVIFHMNTSQEVILERRQWLTITDATKVFLFVFVLELLLFFLYARTKKSIPVAYDCNCIYSATFSFSPFFFFAKEIFKVESKLTNNNEQFLRVYFEMSFFSLFSYLLSLLLHSYHYLYCR